MVVAARDGTVTFERFFRDEYPRLVPMLHAVTGDRQRAEDLAQEALAKAQQDWERVRTLDRPGAWVRRVALNASSNVRRRRGREVAALRRVGRAAEIGDVPAEADPDLWRLVRRLPEQQRWAVALHYVEDRPVAEVAAVLRCSEGSVKTHLSRARATLARQLDDIRKEATS
jgi:RNA polymerase sigma-70 factor (ECF subfamily)